MTKKIIISLLVLVTLLSLTGCANKESKMETSSLVSGPSCKKEFQYQTLEYILDINNDELKSFDIKSTYKYTNLDTMKTACNNNKKEEKDVNDKNIYVKYKVTCDEDKQTITIEKLYDTKKSLKEENIKNMLSYVYKFIKEDSKFDLEGWKETNIKDGFTCS